MNLLFVAAAVLVAVLFFWKSIAADIRFFKTSRRGWLLDKWENWIKPLVIAGILAIGVRSYLIGPYKIPTGSMRPTLMEGDRIFVDKISYRFEGPKRGEVVVFRYPNDRKKDFVKRLIAFGGETIEIKDGQVYIDGKRIEEPPSIAKNTYYNRDDWDFGKKGEKILVPKGHLFFLGDNSAHSSDSRNWGFVPRKDVIGRAVLIWWPPKRLRLIKNS